MNVEHRTSNVQRPIKTRQTLGGRVELAMPRSWESAAVRAVTGPTIRPGGLELTRRMAESFGLGAGDRVLDVGCGSGATAAFLAERYRVTALGLDLSPGLLAEARRGHPRVCVVHGSAQALPVAARSVDAVICECVLSLLPDPRTGMEECFRVLKPGGRLGISDLYLRTAEAREDAVTARPGGCLEGAVDRWTVTERVQSAGFEVLRWEDHSAFLKILAARLVWAGVSLREEWGCDCPPSAGGVRGRPGYFLMIARKRE